MDPARDDLVGFRRGLVVTEHGRPRLLELERDALAHRAHAVHGVDEGIHARVEQVAGSGSDHAASVGPIMPELAAGDLALGPCVTQ